MIINQSGVALRVPVADIRVMGRATQGVKLIDLGKRGDTIASVCKVDAEPEEVEDEENNDATEGAVIENADAAENMDTTDSADAADIVDAADDSDSEA